MHYPKCTSVILSTIIRVSWVFLQVTTKGAGLNPNAKVWQEIPSHQDDVPEWTEDTTWLLTYPPPAMISEGMGFWLQIIAFITSNL